mgnify:FL=1
MAHMIESLLTCLPLRAHVRKCKYMLPLDMSSLRLILYMYKCFSLSRRFYYYYSIGSYNVS